MEFLVSFLCNSADNVPEVKDMQCLLPREVKDLFKINVVKAKIRKAKPILVDQCFFSVPQEDT